MYLVGSLERVHYFNIAEYVVEGEARILYDKM
jgi:hypothetical protein